jgi:uncharacterized protein (DUF305 family)/predicted small secreted protein
LKTLLRTAWLLALLLAIAFLLAACGSAGGGQQGSGSAADGEHGKANESGGMAGMDHSNMNHGSMGMSSGGMAREMIMVNGKYSDKAFIDAMVPHHQGAIEMAQVAYRQSDNPKIKKLAEGIVEAQTREITQMEGWRQLWYPQG